MISKYGYIHPQADATPLPKALALVEERGVSELGENEEGVGGRADSLNFSEVIPSSSRENHFGGKITFFSISAHPHL